MRALIAFLLSLFLTLNAANAAIHGVCDTFEQDVDSELATQHKAHFGHHNHDSVDAAADVTVSSDDSAPTGTNDSTSLNKTHHGHCYTHPSFSSLLSSSPTVPALPESEVLPTLVAAALVSAILPRLERPPRAVLA